MEKKTKKNINDILNKRIKRRRRIERIVGVIGFLIGVGIGIKILIGMVRYIN